MIEQYAGLEAVARESAASQEWWEMLQVLRAIEGVVPPWADQHDKPYYGIVVEIGVDGGGGLTTYRQAFPRLLTIGIDTNERIELKNQNMIYGDSRDQSTLQKLKDLLAGEPIDFLFIDGDHNYETVKSDFEMYSPLVKKGGAVGFHDINNRGIEGVTVDQFMRELDEYHTYKTADYRSNGLKSPGTRIIWLPEY